MMNSATAQQLARMFGVTDPDMLLLVSCLASSKLRLMSKVRDGNQVVMFVELDGQPARVEITGPAIGAILG